ncbi:MAG TPA: MarR family winged helix-turn-helix transcriptional regulator [Caulobacteraceae bacterium]|nr:MarR family winged helix-turn-helix transcriptional regulator [Caulobacteraceae bacterium]
MAKTKHAKAGAGSSVSPTRLLHRALQVALDYHAEAAGPGGLTQRQYTLLQAVGATPGQSQSDLVKNTGIDRSTLADLVARLRAKGFLERRRSASDGRANVVTLSTSGSEALAAGSAPSSEADARLMSLLSPKKGEALVRLLSALTTAADAPKSDLRAKRKAGKTGKRAVKAPKAKKKKRKSAKPTSVSAPKAA